VTSARARAGFSFVEVLVALVLLEVGLVGCAGTLVLAQRQMTAAENVHHATHAAAAIADSVLAAGPVGAGEASEAWGAVRWSVEEGGLLLRAEDGSGARLLDWWIPVAAR
jgi:Tfp pilus assembly protein PilV